MLIFASLLTSCAITSCGGQGTGNDETSTCGDTPPAEETTAEPDRLDELGKHDFGGKKFTILDANDHPDWHVNIHGDSLNGDIVNDALYERDLAIEDKFNVDIGYVQMTNAKTGTDALKKGVLAGDDEYTMCISTILGGTLGTIVSDGVLANLCDNEYLSLDKSGWSYLFKKNLELDGKMYFTTGDISILDNECTMVLFFNKQIIEDNNLDGPYDLVKNGTWTMDKLFAMCDVVASDLNGDSEMDIDNDRFGLFCQNNVPHSFWFGSGERISTADKDGTLKLTMGTERSSEIIPYILENCQKSSIAQMYNWSVDGFNKSVSAFMGGRILYVGWALADINSIRDCKFDFGILPYPKYDEWQSDYYNLISTIYVPGVSIPVTNAESEKAGLILEAMAYYSVDSLTTAYYDNALNTRYVRDEESSDMLDIIFSSRVYDIGYISDVGGLGQLMSKMFKQKQTNFTSNYASLESRAQTALDKLTDSFNKAAEAQK